MKQLLLFSFLLISIANTAQDSEKAEVRKTIESFFDGFHQQDSILIKKTVTESMILQTISKNPVGEVVVREEPFSKFLRGIVGIPKEVKFQEILKSFSIQIDGNMANAWVAYEFRLRNEFSHCGVNSFQLVKFEDGWKIIYLIDTRRKENCD